MWLVVAMGAITYGSRVVLLARSGQPLEGRIDAFLERFPLALFVALATATLLVPDADVKPALGYSAFAGAVAGGILMRRSLIGVLMIGGATYWLARLLVG
jgi:branched-subunit amino acid transport protein